jgi:hypothetical protein
VIVLPVNPKKKENKKPIGFFGVLFWFFGVILAQ